jgi:hypothetical protein
LYRAFYKQACLPLIQRSERKGKKKIVPGKKCANVKYKSLYQRPVIPAGGRAVEPGAINISHLLYQSTDLLHSFFFFGTFSIVRHASADLAFLP